MADIAGGYTTTDALRAAIGVTDNEVSDEMIVSRIVDIELLSDLDTWLTDHATIKADGESASPTADQTSKWRNLQLYCMYYGAFLLLDTGPLAIPQVISDGKSEVRRKQKMDDQAVRDRCLARSVIYKARLGEVATSTYTPIVSATPAYDPVTNT